jgi:hypothetical protein
VVEEVMAVHSVSMVVWAEAEAEVVLLEFEGLCP